jgi:putative NADH-flavin reductase
VLIAGATGYVGQHLVDELLDRGCASAGFRTLPLQCTHADILRHLIMTLEMHASVRLRRWRGCKPCTQARRYTVRALVRRSGQLTAAKDGRCEEAVGDVLRPESLPPACHDCDAVVSCVGGRCLASATCSPSL